MDVVDLRTETFTKDLNNLILKARNKGYFDKGGHFDSTFRISIRP